MPDYESYDFSGGVNKRLSPLMLRPNELADAQNVLPEERGSIQRRYGFTVVNTAQVEAGDRIDGLLKFYREDEDEDNLLLVACGGRIYSVDPGGTPEATDLGDYTIGTDYTIEEDAYCRMVKARNYVFGTSWTDQDNMTMFIVGDHVDGTGGLHAHSWNVKEPTKAPVLTEQNVGSDLLPGGVYQYRLSYFFGLDGALGECRPGPIATQTLTAGFDQITLQFFDDPVGANYQYASWDDAIEHGVSKIRIYRTKDAADDFYFLADIEPSGAGDNTETYVDDGDVDGETADDDLDTGTTPESDRYTGHCSRCLHYHNDRMYQGNIWCPTFGEYKPGRVRWGEAGFPAFFPANNYSDAPGDYGAVMGFATLNGQLFVFYESAIAALSVQYESTHTFRTVTTRAGVKAIKSLVVGKERGRDVAFFLSYDHQVYMFDGTNVRPVSDDIQPVLSTDANQSAMDTCAGGWDGEYYYLSYPNGSDTVPSAELRYNTQVRKMNEFLGYDTGTWWPQVLPTGKAPNVYLQLEGATDTGELYWGNAGETGWIFEHNSGNSDDTANISSMFQTGLNNLGSSSIQKRLRDLLWDMRSWVYLTVRWDLDFETQAGVFVAPESTDRAEYDTGLYYDDGNYYVGDTPTRTKYPFPSHHEGNRLRIKVTADESNAPYKLYGWTVRFEPVREDKAS